MALLMIPFLKQNVPLILICVMGNGPINSNLCLKFSLRLTRICTNLVLVVIPVHIFVFIIMVDSQLFALSNVFPVGNMLNV